jgi:hypothetical protein
VTSMIVSTNVVRTKTLPDTLANHPKVDIHPVWLLATFHESRRECKKPCLLRNCRISGISPAQTRIPNDIVLSIFSLYSEPRGSSMLEVFLRIDNGIASCHCLPPLVGALTFVSAKIRNQEPHFWIYIDSISAKDATIEL